LTFLAHGFGGLLQDDHISIRIDFPRQGIVREHAEKGDGFDFCKELAVLASFFLGHPVTANFGNFFGLLPNACHSRQP